MKLSWGADTWKGQGFRITDDEAEAAGCLVVSVHGVSHRRSELRRECFDPGNPVCLIPGPAPTDLDAIAVWDATGAFQVGYVARDETAGVHAMLAIAPVHATTIWEWVSSEGRHGLKLLISRDQPRVVNDEAWGTRTLEL